MPLILRPSSLAPEIVQSGSGISSGVSFMVGLFRARVRAELAKTTSVPGQLLMSAAADRRWVRTFRISATAW